MQRKKVGMLVILLLLISATVSFASLPLLKCFPTNENVSFVRKDLSANQTLFDDFKPFQTAVEANQEVLSYKTWRRISASA